MTDDRRQQGQDSKVYFAVQFAAFQNKSELASRVSKAIDRRQCSERVGWSQWMHLRLCVAADSLIRLASFQARIQRGEVCTIDQSSISSISRGMIEAAAMIAYMTDQSLKESEWRLRRLIICLHDATTRYKMFKGWKEDAESAAHRANMDRLRLEIEGTLEFMSLPKDRQKKLLSGQEVYIHGLRSVVRLMNWGVEDFNSAYAYLSAHAHSSPVSFIRLAEHGIDFKSPTGAQYATAAIAIEIAGNALEFATERIVSLFPDTAKIVSEFRS